MSGIKSNRCRTKLVEGGRSLTVGAEIDEPFGPMLGGQTRVGAHPPSASLCPRTTSGRRLRNTPSRHSVARYESRTTKSPELNFSALVDGNGARNVRFERALRT
jgi:hypothetical protein